VYKRGRAETGRGGVGVVLLYDRVFSLVAICTFKTVVLCGSIHARTNNKKTMAWICGVYFSDFHYRQLKRVMKKDDTWAFQMELETNQPGGYMPAVVSLAAECGALDIMKFIVNEDMCMPDNETVKRAIRSRREQMVTYLVGLLFKDGPPKDADAWSLMKTATYANSLPIFTYLYEKCELHATNKQDIFELAVKIHSNQIVEHLVDTRKFDVTLNNYAAFHTCVIFDQGNMLSYLFAHVQCISQFHMQTLIHTAVTAQNRGMVFYLCSKTFDREGALHEALGFATEKGKEEVCRHLVENFVRDPHKIDEMLRIACRFGQLDLVKMYLARGAAATGNNNTPLTIAALEGHIDVVTHLRQIGAVPSTIAEETMSDIERRHPAVAAYLRTPLPHSPVAQQHPQASARKRQQMSDPTEVSFLRQQFLDRLRDDDECPVCMEKLKPLQQDHIIFWPKCSHILCIECHANVDKCPTCRKGRPK